MQTKECMMINGKMCLVFIDKDLAVTQSVTVKDGDFVSMFLGSENINGEVKLDLATNTFMVDKGDMFIPVPDFCDEIEVSNKPVVVETCEMITDMSKE